MWSLRATTEPVLWSDINLSLTLVPRIRLSPLVLDLIQRILLVMKVYLRTYYMVYFPMRDSCSSTDTHQSIDRIYSAQWATNWEVLLWRMKSQKQKSQYWYHPKEQLMLNRSTFLIFWENLCINIQWGCNEI